MQRLTDLFSQKGHLRYGVEPVTQVQHALQTAALAEQEEATPQLVVSAFLHDIGHLLSSDDLPKSLAEDLHDRHEERGAIWLETTFGLEVADPIRLHVAAKRYLCTTEQDYAERLSPTSYKSYLDQGGPMSAAEISAFEAEPHFKAAIRLRRWDDSAKRPDMAPAGLNHYLSLVQSCLLQDKTDPRTAS